MTTASSDPAAAALAPFEFTPKGNEPSGRERLPPDAGGFDKNGHLRTTIEESADRLLGSVPDRVTAGSTFAREIFRPKGLRISEAGARPTRGLFDCDPPGHSQLVMEKF